jgi:hypothetical protein
MMSGSEPANRAWRLPLPPWALAALAAAAGSLIYATHLYLYHRLQEEPASFPEELAEAAAHFGAWAVLVPLVLRLARRWELVGPRWPAHLVVHLGAGLVVALVQLFLHTLIDQVFIHGWRDAGPFFDDARRFFVRTYYANVVVYLALVLGAGGLAWARRRRAREAELERHLTVAQLDALRQQLQPHFLFNALNAVSTLIADDPSSAQRMIARLAELLRHALDERNAAEIPLCRELELAGSYLAIEQVRFGDRLTISVDVPLAARQALVPGLLLQPLLENAVRHGVARRPGPGTIEVTARVEDTALRLRVVDRGGELRTPPEGRLPDANYEAHGTSGLGSGGGIGLGNVRARLLHLYGNAQRLDIVPGADGTAVEVRLPLRYAASASTEPPPLAASTR